MTSPTKLLDSLTSYLRMELGRAVNIEIQEGYTAVELVHLKSQVSSLKL
jgi:hypothetical protein